jgi:hypothetical protein
MPRAKTAAKVHNFTKQPSVEAKEKRFWRRKGVFITITTQCFEANLGR